jgi:ubiquinone/menaquinone biosynthesis C-methylase UbiE
MILDVGCGTSKIEESIGIDSNPEVGADVIHDLDTFPYPFENEYFDKVFIRSTLFLLSDPVKVMEEIYRISKPGAEIVVVQPYFRSVWNFVDPYVKSFGTVHSFAFYDPKDPICNRYKYSKARFTVEAIKFDEHLEKKGWLKRILVSFAEKMPRRYEMYLSHIFPLDMITYYLVKI